MPVAPADPPVRRSTSAHSSPLHAGCTLQPASCTLCWQHS